jgi:cytochrome c peroxidase
LSEIGGPSAIHSRPKGIRLDPDCALHVHRDPRRWHSQRRHKSTCPAQVHAASGSSDGSNPCLDTHGQPPDATDGKAVSAGIGGRAGQRNSPTVLNALYKATQFWDGRAVTLEQQAALPIVNSVEMGQPNLDAAVEGIAAIPQYRRAFQSAFGSAPNGTDLVRAIAAYERTQVAFDSPFDHYIAGERNAIDPAARRRWGLFNGRARCNKCHALSEKTRDTTSFTDNDFHNIGVLIVRHNVVALAKQARQMLASGDTEAVDRAAIQTDMSALGRFLVTKKESDIAAFKTPNLRNLLLTAPYFHDGSQATLWDVIDHYNKGRHGPRVRSRTSAEKTSRAIAPKVGGPGPARARGSRGRTEHVRPYESAQSPRDRGSRGRAR